MQKERRGDTTFVICCLGALPFCVVLSAALYFIFCPHLFHSLHTHNTIFIVPDCIKCKGRFFFARTRAIFCVGFSQCMQYVFSVFPLREKKRAAATTKNQQTSSGDVIRICDFGVGVQKEGSMSLTCICKLYITPGPNDCRGDNVARLCRLLCQFLLCRSLCDLWF